MAIKIERLGFHYLIKKEDTTEIGELELHTDGHYYFLETSDSTTYWTPQTLLQLSKEIVKANKVHKIEQQNFFGLPNRGFKKRAKVEYQENLISGLLDNYYPNYTKDYKIDEKEWLAEYKKCEDIKMDVRKPNNKNAV